MMLFLSVFLLPEVVVAVVIVEVFAKETWEAGGAEETPNMPALMKRLSALSNLALSS
jgi:hypothetical protein